MEDEEAQPKDLSPEVSAFLDEKVSYLALTQMTGPLRSTDTILTSVLIDTLIALRSLPLEGEAKDRAESAWTKLEKIFEQMDMLTTRSGRIFNGNHPWDSSGDAKDE